MSRQNVEPRKPNLSIVNIHQALQRLGDYQIEKLILEVLAANFDSVLREEVERSVEHVDQSSLSSSLSALNNEIDALYSCLHTPITRKHHSEEVISMSSRHRLLFACEQLLQYLDDFASPGSTPSDYERSIIPEELLLLKKNHGKKLTDVLNTIALLTLQDINEYSAALGSAIHFEINSDKLREQLICLIKAQHIGALVTKLRQLHSGARDERVKQEIKSVIDSFENIGFKNPEDYVHHYLKIARKEIVKLLVKVDEGTLTTTLDHMFIDLLQFYREQYSSTYLENRRCIASLENPEKVLWKLDNLKYSIILDYQEIKNEISPKLNDIVRELLLKSSDLELYENNAYKIIQTIAEIEKQRKLNKWEEKLLSFAHKICDELRAVTPFNKSKIPQLNQGFLGELSRSRLMRFDPALQTSDPKVLQTYVTHVASICEKLSRIDAEVRANNNPTFLTRKNPLLGELKHIFDFLTGRQQRSRKFIPTTHEESEMLDRISFMTRNQEYIRRLNNYKVSRENSKIYWLYDQRYEDNKGNDKENKTKGYRIRAANFVIEALERAQYKDFSGVLNELTKQIDAIHDDNSALKNVFYEIANDIFDYLNNSRAVVSSPVVQSTVPTLQASLSPIDIANAEIFNKQLLKVIACPADYDSYWKQLIDFSARPETFAKYGFFGGLCELAHKAKNFLVDKIWHKDFERKLKNEHKQILKIESFVNAYNTYTGKRSISDFYTQLYILCNNVIMQTDNTLLHEDLQEIKDKILQRFKPGTSAHSQIKFSVEQCQSIKYSDQMMSGEHDDTDRKNNFTYLQRKKDNALEIGQSKNNNLAEAYDYLVSKINNRFFAEKVADTGIFQKCPTQEMRALDKVKSMLHKVGLPETAIDLFSGHIEKHLEEKEEEKTAAIARAAPLARNADEKSMRYAEKTIDVYRYQIQHLVRPQYLHKFLDIVVERLFTAISSGEGLTDDVILLHIHNNSQKHSWNGFFKTSIGSIEIKDAAGKTDTKPLEAEDLLQRPGVIVFDEAGKPTYYTLDRPYLSTACEYNVYGFIVLDKLPENMRKLTKEELDACKCKPDEETLKYYERKVKISVEASAQTEQMKERLKEISKVKPAEGHGKLKKNKGSDSEEELIVLGKSK